MAQEVFPFNPAGIKITLIDDDSAVRIGVSRLLRSLGCSCRVLESGEAALTDLGLAESDCLIMDVQMLGIDGIETRDRLHLLGIKIPTVFITALTESSSPDLMARMNNSPCLRKPFEVVELLAAIQNLLHPSS